MKKEDVEHLSRLARVRLTDSELADFTTDISDIIDYVSVVQSMAAGGEKETETEPELGPRYNVFRSDVVTNEPDAYTEDLLREMPYKEGRFLKVKKILQTDTE
ncbi:MAG: aspartyl/glutamyl-tRNA amidotransferase subunit C [Candidatus Nomurabacteria bacterium]|nr:MAG: aspartyl/glutamyl-tRNA amidotransferase subunit C [Candidatus Nomurabacteria bacterium]